MRKLAMKTSFRTASFVIAAASGTFVFTSREARPQVASRFVTTISGNVQGADNGVSCAFLGVPFAAPPAGATE